MSGKRDPLQQFEHDFKRWAEHPPATPPEVAARELADRLPLRRRWRPVPVALLAAAAALLLVLGLQLLPGLLAPKPSTTAAVPADDPLLAISLDDQTTLYLILTPPLEPEGKKGRTS